MSKNIMVRKKKGTSFDFTTVDFSVIKNDSPSFERDFTRAEAYLRESFKSKVFKKEAIKWIKKEDKKQAKLLTSLEDWRFSIIGKLCYFLNRGADIPEEGFSYIENKLSEYDSLARSKVKETKEKEEKKSETKYTVQDYLRFKACAVAGEYFESWIDEFIEDPKSFKAANYDPLTVMRTNELSQGHARHIVAMYEDNIAEIRGLLEGKNTEYCQHTKPQLKQLLVLYESITDAAQMIIATSVASRKPRKVRKIDISKKVAKLKYLKEFKDLGLVSISPLKIVGTKELWVYNTKTRKVGKYVAFDAAGIDVTGTTIKNINTTKSTQKHLRKPKEQIKNFQDGGIRKLNNQFKAIDNAVEIPLKPRMNDNIVILAAFK